MEAVDFEHVDFISYKSEKWHDVTGPKLVGQHYVCTTCLKKVRRKMALRQ